MKELIETLDKAIDNYKSAFMIAERFPSPENLIKAHNRKQTMIDIMQRVIEEHTKKNLPKYA